MDECDEEATEIARQKRQLERDHRKACARLWKLQSVNTKRGSISAREFQAQNGEEAKTDEDGKDDKSDEEDGDAADDDGAESDSTVNTDAEEPSRHGRAERLRYAL